MVSALLKFLLGATMVGGILYLITRHPLTMSVTQSGVPVTWAATGGTPNGNLKITVIDPSKQTTFTTATFDLKGKFARTFEEGVSLSGSWNFLLEDIATGKTTETSSILIAT